jgi:hypothetical protein
MYKQLINKLDKDSRKILGLKREKSVPDHMAAITQLEKRLVQEAPTLAQKDQDEIYSNLATHYADCANTHKNTGAFQQENLCWEQAINYMLKIETRLSPEDIKKLKEYWMNCHRFYMFKEKDWQHAQQQSQKIVESLISLIKAIPSPALEYYTLLATCLHHLGVFCQTQKEYWSAKSFYQAGIDILEKVNSKESQSTLRAIKGQLEFLEKKVPKSHFSLLELTRSYYQKKLCENEGYLENERKKLSEELYQKIITPPRILKQLSQLGLFAKKAQTELTCEEAITSDLAIGSSAFPSLQATK